MSGYDNLNPQIKKLLEETGTKISNQADLDALSRVSVRDLAKLFDELARMNKDTSGRSKKDVLAQWTANIVKKFNEQTPVTSPTVPKPSGHDIYMDADRKILTDHEREKRDAQLKKADAGIIEYEEQLKKLREDARNAADNGDEKQLENLKKKMIELKSKRRKAIQRSEKLRDSAFYKTVFFKKSARLEKLGQSNSTTKPQLLTLPTDDLSVSVIKHTFDDCIVLQFELHNNIGDQGPITNANVELDTVPDGLNVTDNFPAPELDADASKPASLFVTLAKEDVDGLPFGFINNAIINYSVDGDERQLPLKNFEILITDYLAPEEDSGINFDLAYDKHKKNEQKAELELPFKYGDLYDALEILEHSLGNLKPPNDALEKKLADRNIKRHTTNYMGNGKNKGNKKPILIKADIVVNDETGQVTANLTMHGPDAEYLEMIADGIRDNLNLSLNALVNKIKDEDMKHERDVFRNVPELCSLGIPFKSCEPVDITPEGLEGLEIKGIKHVLPDGDIVIEFVCTNTLDNGIFENLTIGLPTDIGQVLKQDKTVKMKGELSKQPESTFVSYNKLDPENYSSHSAKGKLKAKLKKLDPKTNIMSRGHEIVFDLLDLDLLSPTDRIKDGFEGFDPSSFDEQFENAADNAVAKTFEFLPTDSLQDAVDGLDVGLTPLSERLVPDDEKSHNLRFVAETLDGPPILVDAQFDSDPTRVTLQVRSGDPDAAQTLADAIISQLQKNKDQKLDDAAKANQFALDLADLVAAENNDVAQLFEEVAKLEKQIEDATGKRVWDLVNDWEKRLQGLLDDGHKRGEGRRFNTQKLRDDLNNGINKKKHLLKKLQKKVDSPKLDDDAKLKAERDVAQELQLIDKLEKALADLDNHLKLSDTARKQKEQDAASAKKKRQANLKKLLDADELRKQEELEKKQQEEEKARLEKQAEEKRKLDDLAELEKQKQAGLDLFSELGQPIYTAPVPIDLVPAELKDLGVELVTYATPGHLVLELKTKDKNFNKKPLTKLKKLTGELVPKDGKGHFELDQIVDVDRLVGDHPGSVFLAYKNDGFPTGVVTPKLKFVKSEIDEKGNELGKETPIELSLNDFTIGLDDYGLDFGKLGVPHVSTAPHTLVDDDAIQVDCIKHIFDDKVVLQYNLLGKQDEAEIDKFDVSMDDSLGPRVLGIRHMPENEPSLRTCFVALDTKDKVLEPLDLLSNLDWTTRIGNDPTDGSLQGIDQLSPYDYIKHDSDTALSFPQQWIKLAGNENALEFDFHPKDKLSDAVESVHRNCGLKPLKSLDDDTVQGDKHLVQFSGISPKGEPLLIEAQLEKKGQDPVKLKLATRSIDTVARTNVPKELIRKLEQEKSEREEEVEHNLVAPQFDDLQNLMLDDIEEEPEAPEEEISIDTSVLSADQLRELQEIEAEKEVNELLHIQSPTEDSINILDDLKSLDPPSLESAVIGLESTAQPEEVVDAAPVKDELGAKGAAVDSAAKQPEDESTKKGKAPPQKGAAKASQVPQHEVNVSDMEDVKWLKARFDVIKIDPKATFKQHQKRTWEIDFFGKKFSNMKRSGKVQKTQAPERLFQIEKNMLDLRKVRMQFFEASHSYELAFESNQLREKFYECSSSIRPTLYVWCPNICKPNEVRCRTMLHGAFQMTENKEKKNVSGSCHINVTSKPYEPITVFCGTWNMASQPPPVDPRILRNFIKVGEYDLYAVGVQESGFTTNQNQFLQYFQSIMGADYITLASVTLWQIQLIVMCRKRHFMKVTNVQGGEKATGFMNLAGNKGGVGICLRFNETTMLFVSCHLAANKGKAAKENAVTDNTSLRNSNVSEIIDALKLGNKDLDIEGQFQHIFFLGDMNYRVELDYDTAVKYALDENYAALLEKDQLVQQMNLGKVFTGFQEGPIKFAPSYKYDIDGDDFDKKKKRTPSYTDRILWKSFPGNPVTCQSYDSVPEVKLSDHRPVHAVYKVNTVRPYASIFSKSDGSCNIVFDEISITGRNIEEVIQNPVLTFYSHWVDQYPQTGNKLFKPTPNPKWTARQIPVVVPSTPNKEYLKIQYLVITLRDGKPKGDTSNLLGTTVLLLKDGVVKSPDSCTFKDLPLSLHGTHVGKMSGIYTLVYSK